MQVRNCVAHDGQRAPIQLVDEKGCVVREKIMSPFKKIKNFDTTANVLQYAYFQVRAYIKLNLKANIEHITHKIKNLALNPMHLLHKHYSLNCCSFHYLSQMIHKY